MQAEKKSGKINQADSMVFQTESNSKNTVIKYLPTRKKIEHALNNPKEVWSGPSIDVCIDARRNLDGRQRKFRI